jgi:hypothetical protein
MHGCAYTTQLFADLCCRVLVSFQLLEHNLTDAGSICDKQERQQDEIEKLSVR